ncbi:MAG TPA: acyltransferase [Mycobacteriales bacterium]|nr:acyltransferase [Mycobacteriales bacterium]
MPERALAQGAPNAAPDAAADPPPPRRITALDGMRAVGVLLVVAFHSRVPASSAGRLGVDVFFAISGFVITQVLTNDLDRGALDLGRFWLRRFVRLFPPLLALVVLAAPLATRLPPTYTLRGYVSSAIEALTYTKDYTSANAHGISDGLGHTWSLAVEEQFYILWPLLLMLLLRRRLAIALTALVGLATASAVALATPHDKHLSTYFEGHDRLTALLLGGAMFLLLHGRAGARQVLARPAVGLVAAAGIVLGVVSASTSTGQTYVHVLLRFAIPMTDVSSAVLVGHLAAAGSSPLAPFLDSRVMQWVGKRSYSIYLAHLPVVTPIVYAAHLGLGWAWLVAAPAGIAAGAFLYAIAEAPALRWSGRLRVTAPARDRWVHIAGVAIAVAVAAATAWSAAQHSIGVFITDRW